MADKKRPTAPPKRVGMIKVAKRETAGAKKPKAMSKVSYDRPIPTQSKKKG